MEDGRATPFLAYREESGLGRILRRSGVLDRLHGRLDPAFRSHATLTLASLARSGRVLVWTPLNLVRRASAAGAGVSEPPRRGRAAGAP